MLIKSLVREIIDMLCLWMAMSMPISAARMITPAG